MASDQLKDRARGKAGAAANTVKEVTKDKGEDKQKMLLSQDAGHFSMVRALHLADLITCGNLFSGFQSITWSIRYAVHAQNPHAPGNPFFPIWIALAWIPMGMAFDLFDGKVARWRGKSSLMGQELDSLADLVSFGVAPAAAAFALGLRANLDHLALSFFVLCALCRLARFNVTVSMLPKDATGKSKYFEGFPAPTSLALVGWMAWWVYNGQNFDNVPGGVLAKGTMFEVHPVVAAFVVHGCMMVSRTVHVPKP